MVTVFGPAVIMEQNNIHLLLLAFWGGEGGSVGGWGGVTCVEVLVFMCYIVSVRVGSGRVTFGNPKSFLKAVQSGFMEIKTSKFTKKVR